jgi:3-hydroxyacyl-CoA dehydrogenase
MISVEYKVQGAVAVVSFSNPPVNVLSHAMRADIQAALDRAEADATVRAVVLTGTEKAFSGGADIKEMGTPKATSFPTLHDMIARLDDMKKPVIAAMSGFSVGGGPILGLGCHYRLARKGTRISFPEIDIGRVATPGTQLLPRLVGVDYSIELLVGGKFVSPERARQMGLLDEVIDGDVVAGAVKFAEGLLAAGKGVRRVRDMAVPPSDGKAEMDRKFPRGMKLPGLIIDCIQVATHMSVEEGMEYAHHIAQDVLKTTESKAVAYAAASERIAQKIPDVPPDTPKRTIRTAAVLGAGTMGGGITMCFANAGIPVTVIEVKQEALDKGLAVIKRNYMATASKGRLTEADVEKRMGLITGSLDRNSAATADIIVEAVYEDLDLKCEIFKALDGIAKPGAILASNTSGLDIDKMAAGTKRPEDVIGAHFFSPANVMRLLEVVRGAKTSKEVIATVMDLAKRMGKAPVLSRVCDAFICNRMMKPVRSQNTAMLEEGASPKQIDDALLAFGMAMGPYRSADNSGIDVGWRGRQSRKKAGLPFVPDDLVDGLCEMGRWGWKTGRGWYRYEADGRGGFSRTALPDSEVEAYLAAYRKKLGVQPRDISEQEIIDRYMFALANEGAKILEEGIAIRASDIDVTYLTGRGFPMHRGGPMFNADVVGLKNVVAAIERYQTYYQGELWKPSKLLLQLAAEGKSFKDYDATKK